MQVDCKTVNQWLRKNSAESENANWILANTKPCPKCKRPIEKNQGCMHMAAITPAIGEANLHSLSRAVAFTDNKMLRLVILLYSQPNFAVGSKD